MPHPLPQRRIQMRKLLNSRLARAILLLVLSCSIAVGSTIAWLISKTDPIVNTFTYGDIDITLEETPTDDDDDDPNTNEYLMVPGSEIVKDPKVTVKADSEACWLFVKLEKSTDPAFDTFLSYEMDELWTALEGVEGVYYVQVAKSAEDQVFTVIKNNIVTVKPSVDKAMLNALTACPTLTVTAYAVQSDNLASVADAWALVQ